MRKPLFACVLGLTVVSFAFADDWPQFRGPDRSGVSKEKGLLKAWPKDGPKLLWTFRDAGVGHSSMAIAKGVVYTLGTDKGDKNEIIIAIDEKTGKLKWTAKLGDVYTYKGNVYGDGPRSTPTVDGNFLYALSGLGELVCVDVTKEGKEVWRKSLVKDFQGAIMDKYGFSESPLVDGDLVICTPGGPQGTLAALDKKTGKLVWRTKGWVESAPFSSAIVAEIQGVRQYLQIGYTGGNDGASIAGVDAKKGTVLWKSQIFTGNSEGASTSPIVKGNEVYVTAGFNAGCHLFEIDKKMEATDLYSKKSQKRMKNTHGGIVLIGDHLYGHTEPGAWLCQDWKTGGEEWYEKVGMSCKTGAIIAADGKLILYTEDGELGLVDADPKGYNEVSTFDKQEKSKIPANGVNRLSRLWAHPAIANGVLYTRDRDLIFAYAIADQKAAAAPKAVAPKTVAPTPCPNMR